MSLGNAEPQVVNHLLASEPDASLRFNCQYQISSIYEIQ